MASWYFAYGSNMNPERVKERGLAFDDVQAGQLRGYQLVFNKRSVNYPGAASANVQKRPGFCVEGVIYHLPQANCIEVMDPFENYPTSYDRYGLPIVVDDMLQTAWVYVANEDHIGLELKPASWYLQHLLKGEAYLSKQYFNALSQVECLPSTDTEPK